MIVVAVFTAALVVDADVWIRSEKDGTAIPNAAVWIENRSNQPVTGYATSDTQGKAAIVSPPPRGTIKAEAENFQNTRGRWPILSNPKTLRMMPATRFSYSVESNCYETRAVAQRSTRADGATVVVRRVQLERIGCGEIEGVKKVALRPPQMPLPFGYRYRLARAESWWDADRQMFAHRGYFYVVRIQRVIQTGPPCGSW